MLLNTVALLGLATTVVAFPPNHHQGPACGAPKPTPTPTSDDCSTRTVCVDYVNNCGVRYGTCMPDCKPWPTSLLGEPPCSTSTTLATTSISTLTLPPISSSPGCESSTICSDGFKTCGTTAILTYGGCFPACEPWPTFTPPPCPTGGTTVVTPPPVVTSTPGCESSSICSDLFRTCGTTAILTYGGCFPACDPYPTFSPPPCPTAEPTYGM